MLIDRVVPQRWQSLVREALKFGTVGGINFVINFAVFNALILTVFPQGQLKANVIATVVATTASYLMNRHWTYRDRPKSAMHREYALFFLFNGVGLAIELGVLGIAKYGLGLTGILALNAFKLLAISLGTLFRFWAYRTFVFRDLPKDEATEEAIAAAEQVVHPLPAELDEKPVDESRPVNKPRTGVEWDALAHRP